jgi:hypothetical protein
LTEDDAFRYFEGMYDELASSSVERSSLFARAAKI